VSIASWILMFFIAIWLLGFSFAVPLTMFLYLKLGAKEKWSTTLILTACGWAFFYTVFAYALRIPFPEGILTIWLS
jgi:hypothetical protein